jgi:HSP20 family protein
MPVFLENEIKVERSCFDAGDLLIFFDHMGMCKVNTPLRFEKPKPAPTMREATSDNSWVPNTDMYMTNDGLVIKVELAGMSKKELELSYDNNQLRINGHRSDCCRNKAAKCEFIMMEINYGSFESLITIPPGYDLSRASAMYQNGFLRIDVPPQSHSAGKAVSIRFSSE